MNAHDRARLARLRRSQECYESLDAVLGVTLVCGFLYAATYMLTYW